MTLATGRRTHIVLRSPGERVALNLPVRGLYALVALVAALVATLAISLTVGSYEIDVPTVIKTLAGEAPSRAIENVVWQFRFPRALAAALVGAMMALSGGALQTLTRNGLADPSLVGISQGAALAVVIAVVALPNLPSELRPLLAFGGALGVAGLIQVLNRRERGNAAIRFILLGIGLSALVSSMTSALLTYGDIDRVGTALAWMAGSVGAVSWADVSLLALWMCVLFPLLMGLTHAMATLRMGEDMAVGLGVPVKRVRRALICTSVALAAVATAIVGPLGFVGLLAPHMARRFAPAGMGVHTGLTACCGALLVAIADLVGRAAFAPVQIPAGLITTIIGVPVFVSLLLRSAARSQL